MHKHTQVSVVQSTTSDSLLRQVKDVEGERDELAETLTEESRKGVQGQQHTVDALSA